MMPWKWFVQDIITKEMKAGDSHKQGDSFPLGLTLELCEESPDSIVTWAVPYEKSSTNQQRAALWTVVLR